MKEVLSGALFQKIKNEILLNRLHPGDRISELALCEEYHLSRPPVRQTLQQLQALGLVEIRDGVGTFVTHIRPEQMRDAYEIRCAAEKIAIATAMWNITPQELGAFEEKFRRFEAQLAKGGGYGASFEEMVQADWELHDLILARSENRLLEEALQKVTLILRRYQMAYVTLYERATADHLEILRCIREKDLPGANKILEEHLQFRTL